MMFRRPIRRTRSGTYQLNLGPGERGLLAALAPQLRDLLSDPDQPGLRRLFPPAYGDEGDAEYEEEYRRFMHDDLVARHEAALDVLAETANANELDAEQMETWMRALNQLRLVLGTRLDVTEDDDFTNTEDPDRQVYYLLGYLQECVVEALSS
ncbi:MAG: DUF2017 domain-containing protein [Acidimicrobiaceae bacterium]|nr:DUF2017 domain-containing protein [Acidimicrobiaceae bacterium]